MKITYEDYDIDDARLEVLLSLAEDFLLALEKDVRKYDNDPMSNSKAVHVSGTEEQSNCFLWFKKRVLLITASIFLVRICLYMKKLILIIKKHYH